MISKLCMMKSNFYTTVPPDGTPCLYARKKASTKKARGIDDNKSSSQLNITKRINPMRVHVKTAIPAKRSALTMLLYTDEVKTMEEISILLIDILGIRNVRPNEIEIFYMGIYYMNSMTMFRDEDVVEVRPMKKISQNQYLTRTGIFLFFVTTILIIVKITGTRNTQEIAITNFVK